MFSYSRTIRFHETDAAGVVYFANALSLCHETFEAALAASDFDLKTFFGGAPLVTPVVHATIDFHRPLYCGDACLIWMQPMAIPAEQRARCDQFEVRYQVFLATDIVGTEPPKPAVRASIRHVCLAAASRQRHPLDPALLAWIDQWSTAPVPAVG